MRRTTDCRCPANRAVRHTVLLVVFAALWVALSGCSGSGRKFESGANLSALASNQASAAMFARRWLTVMYRDSPSAGPPQCPPSLEHEPTPEGLIIRIGNTDCSTGEYLQRFDGSGEGTVTYPDGSTETLWWDARVEVGPNETVRHQGQTFCDGTEWVFDFRVNSETLINANEGYFRLPPPDGRILDYAATHDQISGLHTLELQPDDGSHMTMRIQEADEMPDPAVPIVGTFQGPEGRSLSYEIVRGEGTPLVWTEWRSTTPEGLRGQYALGDEFAGYGPVEEGGETLGLLSWTSAGTAAFDRTGGGVLTGQASAASLDFLVDQWVYRLGQLGPTPR